MNGYQLTVIHATGWFLVLLDGWEMHTHWVAGLGFVFMFFSMWRICMKTPEDEAFEEMEKAQGWRKRQIEENISIDDAFNDWAHSHRPEQFWVERKAFHAGWVAAMRRARD